MCMSNRQCRGNHRAAYVDGRLEVRIIKLKDKRCRSVDERSAENRRVIDKRNGTSLRAWKCLLSHMSAADSILVMGSTKHAADDIEYTKLGTLHDLVWQRLVTILRGP